MFLGLSSFRRQNAIFMTAKNMLDFKRQKSTHKREDTGHLKCVILKKNPKILQKTQCKFVRNFFCAISNKKCTIDRICECSLLFQGRTFVT